MKIGCDLTKKGVSVVNLGNLAFLRYAGIFQRQKAPMLDLPVAVVTDLDVKPVNEATEKESKTAAKNEKYNGDAVKTFVSPHWTLEYCIASSTALRQTFYKAVLMALREQKQDEGVSDSRLEKYSEEIRRVETHFDGWTKSDTEVAESIYHQILGEQKVLELCIAKISKAIIAQHFARLIEDEVPAYYRSERKKISYLIDAIKYACRTNNH